MPFQKYQCFPLSFYLCCEYKCSALFSMERLERRTERIERGDYNDAMFDLARQFANAEKIVISAPFWDLSFPSILKIYIENIYVTGIVSQYGSDGRPQGLCRAEKLYYVTTAGGPYVSDYSYDYIKSLAKDYFGISDTKLVKAQMLDVQGYDAEEIVRHTIQNLCV